MRAYRAQTMTELHTKLCENLVLAPKDKLDVVSSVDVQVHDTISEAVKMEWAFDLKDMWLTKGRWSMMVRQYIDPDEFVLWIDKITAKLGLQDRGVAFMRTKTVKPRGGAATGHANKETRRWGSCMLGVSYKAVPQPTISLWSRTSYLGYLAAMDMTVAWMCGVYLAKELGCRVEDFRFVWYNEAQQYHNFKSLAFLLNHTDPAKRAMYRRILLTPDPDDIPPKEQALIQRAPGLRLSRKWMESMLKLDLAGKSYGDMSYNTYRRIRRRYHTEVLGYETAQMFEGWDHYKKGPRLGEQKDYYKAYQPLDSVTADMLDFSAIGLPFGVPLGADWEGGGAEDEGDDE